MHQHFYFGVTVISFRLTEIVTGQWSSIVTDMVIKCLKNFIQSAVEIGISWCSFLYFLYFLRTEELISRTTYWKFSANILTDYYIKSKYISHIKTLYIFKLMILLPTRVWFENRLQQEVAKAFQSWFQQWNHPQPWASNQIIGIWNLTPEKQADNIYLTCCCEDYYL